MALELKHVTKTFGGVRAVDDVSMVFDPGEVTALIGPNGAGKSTLFNVVNGLLRPDEGGVVYRNEELTSLKPHQVAQRGVGRLFQKVRLFDRMTVLDNVLSAFPDQQGESAWRSVFTRSSVNREERVRTSHAMDLLDQVGIPEKADALGEDLSYGQQKLAAIARLLAMGADALLFDEPVAGVNPDLTDTLLETICRLAEEGKIVAVVEHDMNVVLDIADWAYFMNDGQRAAAGHPRDVLSEPDVRAAYAGVEEAPKRDKSS